MDVAIAIDAEAVTVGHIVKGGSWVNHKWVENNAGAVNIQAAVQPASGRQLMDLPEGVRTEAKFLLWTRSTISEDDLITFGGETWRIVFKWPRPMDGFNRAALGKK